MKNESDGNPEGSNVLPVMNSFEAYIAILLANSQPGILYSLVDGADFLVPPEERGGESAALGNGGAASPSTASGVPPAKSP